MKFLTGGLGRDFWLYRFGQAISVIGDGCSNIALAWWILDKTGSPAKMASIMAPALLARAVFTPLFGPFGDKFPRKTLIIIGDIWRGALTFALAFMVISGYFNLGIVIIIFMFLAVGSAFFYAGAGGIVPQLVPSGKLQEAMQQSQAVSSGGSILGGILGGILVSALGTGGAFAADALSYFIAAIATYKIKADTMPRRHSEHKHEHTFTAWLAELKEGFYVVWKIPVEFWMTIVFALLNFIVGPIIVGLPVLVKQSRGLPPWFYGGLYSSISIGIIAGSLIVGRVCKIVWQDIVIMAGIIVMGIGFSLLPWMPGMLLPLLVMMFFGVGNAFTNIPATAQPLIAMPDRFRARTSSVSTFLCMVINPLGIAVSGIIIARYGVEATISICGILIILFAPLLYLIPNFSRFYRLEPKQAETFFTENYPEAFKARWPVDLSSETKTASQTNLKNR